MRNESFRRIPKIDRLMEMEPVKELAGKYGYTAALEAARKAEEKLRSRMQQPDMDWVCALTSEACVEYIWQEMRRSLESNSKKRMQRVINGTGVILHTNLGRAPLGEALVSELVPLMTGYTNLEMNLENGKRGSRYDHFEDDICRLTGAEAAIAVNNNAAAVLVMLTALASGGETVVSRGELVEIGGKFRIPDVCSQSGTMLVEVGTTNRTYLKDYEYAVTENTAAFLKVHTSNYQITGFTCEPELSQLAKAAHSHDLPLLVDLGSGSFVDMALYGIQSEKTVQELLQKGADIVSFSGDKLLGGPQAGILVGRKALIEKISGHPLMRALRIDKFTAAALDKTVSAYLDEGKLENTLPVYEMLGRSVEELENMGRELLEKLHISSEGAEDNSFVYQLVSSENVVGGGTTPGKSLPGAAIRIKSKDGSIPAQEISDRLRKMEVPVIGYIADDWVYVEMRTILSGELEILKKELKTL